MNIKSWILGLSMAAVLITPMAAEAHILDGAQEYNGHYYKNFEFPLSWDQAEQFCKSVGGHLATIESSDELSVVNETMNTGGQVTYWLGGYKDAKGFWLWITGSIITNSNWSSHSPGSSKKATRMRAFPGSGQWVDDNGSKELSFICEWESYADAHDSSM